MIRELFWALGPAGAGPLRRLLWGLLGASVLQAGVLLALVPVLAELAAGRARPAPLLLLLGLSVCFS